MRAALSEQFNELKVSSQSVLKQLDADFDKVLVMINRRKQLVKQQVMSQYEDKLCKCRNMDGYFSILVRPNHSFCSS